MALEICKRERPTLTSPREKSFSRHIHVSHILKGQAPETGDFLEVRVLWTSGIKQVSFPQQRDLVLECNFILADETGYIYAKLRLWSLQDSNGRNICGLLQQSVGNDVRRIVEFSVKKFAANSISSVVNGKSFSLLGEQVRYIELSHSSLNVKRETRQDLSKFLKYLPVCFTGFMEIDDMVNIGDDGVREFGFVDIIGFVEAVIDDVKQKFNGETIHYQRVILRSSMNKHPGCYYREVALFSDRIDSVTKGGVYLFSTVSVGVYSNNASLKANYRTIIMKIDEKNAKFLFSPNLLVSDIFLDLFSPSCLPQPTQPCPELLEENFSLISLEEESPAKRRRVGDEEPGTKKHISSLFFCVNVEPEPKVNDNEDTDSDMPELLDRPGTTLDILSATPVEVRQPEPEEMEDAKEIYNFLSTNKPLKVIVQKSGKFMDIDPNCYRMRSNPRGVALIIHNTHFPHRDNEKGVERKGGVRDAVYLKEFLEQCGNFAVFVKHNLCSTDLLNVIAEFKETVEQKHRDVDSLVVAVLSHGSYGTVEMCDGMNVTLHESIIFQFDETLFPVMKGKPKIFILQTCQHFNHGGQAVTVTLDNRYQRNGGGVQNMIICYPSSPGSESLRDIHLGSHFIYVLTDVLMKNAHQMDLVSMLELVQKALRNIKYGGNEILACTWAAYSFKKLFLNPGITTDKENTSVKKHKRGEVRKWVACDSDTCPVNK